jgi:hypothetical protein
MVIAIVFLLANVCETFAAVGLGVLVASRAVGEAIFPPKAVEVRAQSSLP